VAAVEVNMVVAQLLVDLVVAVAVTAAAVVQETHLPLVQVKDQAEAAAVVQI
jgi:hypothetical protein